jgi:hypothetical protein
MAFALVKVLNKRRLLRVGAAAVQSRMQRVAGME